ncbi:hypothetical protein VTK73DRAFT_1989 [Phialemonium thermophilum]|uniref:Uncharacterized protein n=1 Tax=Phialemonium thermophilum TaxID=223376 RepID=A0ABR3VSS9_9PEZI
MGMSNLAAYSVPTAREALRCLHEQISCGNLEEAGRLLRTTKKCIWGIYNATHHRLIWSRRCGTRSCFTFPMHSSLDDNLSTYDVQEPNRLPMTRLTSPPSAPDSWPAPARRLCSLM